MGFKGGIGCDIACGIGRVFSLKYRMKLNILVLGKTYLSKITQKI